MSPLVLSMMETGTPHCIAWTPRFLRYFFDYFYFNTSFVVPRLFHLLSTYKCNLSYKVYRRDSSITRLLIFTSPSVSIFRNPRPHLLSQGPSHVSHTLPFLELFGFLYFPSGHRYTDTLTGPPSITGRVFRNIWCHHLNVKKLYFASFCTLKWVPKV